MFSLSYTHTHTHTHTDTHMHTHPSHQVVWLFWLYKWLYQRHLCYTQWQTEDRATTMLHNKWKLLLIIFWDFYFFHYSWFTVFCQYLLYSKVTHSYIHIYICTYIYYFSYIILHHVPSQETDFWLLCFKVINHVFGWFIVAVEEKLIWWDSYSFYFHTFVQWIVLFLENTAIVPFPWRFLGRLKPEYALSVPQTPTFCSLILGKFKLSFLQALRLSDCVIRGVTWGGGVVFVGTFWRREGLGWGHHYVVVDEWKRRLQHLGHCADFLSIIKRVL